jgi:hypothetical protein
MRIFSLAALAIIFFQYKTTRNLSVGLSTCKDNLERTIVEQNSETQKLIIEKYNQILCEIKSTECLDSNNIIIDEKT